MIEAAPVSRSAEHDALRARNSELVGQLRTAAMEGDDARITRLLSELLRCQGLTRRQRVSLQLKALLNLVHSLRSVALNDDLTGLCNHRGFVQIGTRLLDVATREERFAHLICCDVDLAREHGETGVRPAGEVLLRQMGNFMRDLFPDYGVYEVLGRLGSDEFAALTTSPDYASRRSIMLRANRSQTRSYGLPALSLHVGVAHFNPRRPVGINELLSDAHQAMHEHKRVTQIASSELAPHAA